MSAIAYVEVGPEGASLLVAENVVRPRDVLERVAAKLAIYGNNDAVKYERLRKSELSEQYSDGWVLDQTKVLILADQAMYGCAPLGDEPWQWEGSDAAEFGYRIGPPARMKPVVVPVKWSFTGYVATLKDRLCL